MSTQARFGASLFVVAVATGLCVGSGEAQATGEGQEEEPLVLNVRDVAWGPPGDRPRFPLGVRTFSLGVDRDHGGPSYLASFPGGSHFDLHWHTHAEYVVVISGRGTLVLGGEDHALLAGTYVVIPERMHHSWDVPAGDEELIILVRRRGPADFHFVDP